MTAKMALNSLLSWLAMMFNLSLLTLSILFDFWSCGSVGLILNSFVGWLLVWATWLWWFLLCCFLFGLMMKFWVLMISLFYEEPIPLMRDLEPYGNDDLQLQLLWWRFVLLNIDFSLSSIWKFMMSCFLCPSFLDLMKICFVVVISGFEDVLGYSLTPLKLEGIWSLICWVFFHLLHYWSLLEVVMRLVAVWGWLHVLCCLIFGNKVEVLCCLIFCKWIHRTFCFDFIVCTDLSQIWFFWRNV